MNIGSFRQSIQSSKTKNKFNRSAHCGFAVKFQSLSKMLIKYLLKLGIINWLGNPLTPQDLSLLLNLYLCGKITTKQFLAFFLQKDAPITNFRYSNNNDGLNNEYLEQKLKNIFGYFKQNKNYLQLQRKLIRKIFYYLSIILPYAQWFYLLKNKYYANQPYLKYLNKKFKTLYGIKFSHYISGKDSLNIIELCQPIIEIIKQKQLQQLSKITEQQKKNFQQFRRKVQKQNLHFEYQSNCWNEFQIRQSQAYAKLCKQDQIALMHSYRTYTDQVISLYTNPNQRLQRRYVPTPFVSEIFQTEFEQEQREILQTGQISESHERSSDEMAEDFMIESQKMDEQHNRDAIQTTHRFVQSSNIISQKQPNDFLFMEQEQFADKQSQLPLFDDFFTNHSAPLTNIQFYLQQLHSTANQKSQKQCIWKLDQDQFKQLELPIRCGTRYQDNDIFQ